MLDLRNILLLIFYFSIFFLCLMPILFCFTLPFSVKFLIIHIILHLISIMIIFCFLSRCLRILMINEMLISNLLTNNVFRLIQIVSILGELHHHWSISLVLYLVLLLLKCFFLLLTYSPFTTRFLCLLLLHHFLIITTTKTMTTSPALISQMILSLN